MNGQEILCEDIYFDSSLLIKKYLKLIKEENTYLLGNEIIDIYENICSLKAKNDKEIQFKNYCINFIKGNIECQFPNIFNKIENLKGKNNLNKEQIFEISENKKNEINDDIKIINNLNINEKNIINYKNKEIKIYEKKEKCNINFNYIDINNKDKGIINDKKYNEFNKKKFATIKKINRTFESIL